MGIALFSFEKVSGRLRAAWQAWSGTPASTPGTQGRGATNQVPGGRQADGLRVSREPHAAGSVRPRPNHAACPVRVLQVMEQAPGQATAGPRARQWNGPARTGGLAQAGSAASGAAAQCTCPSARPAVRAAGLVASRMVISGRLADVCAELERLAALESDGVQALAPTR